MSAPELTHVRVDVDGDPAICTVTIDRAGDDLNRIDGALHRDLATVIAWLRREPPARAVHLRAEGRAFSAGGDFAWFPTLQDPAARAEVARHGKQLIWDLLDIPVPVVSEVGGAAVGLAASIVLLTDVVVLGRRASLADPHVQVGIAAGDGGVVAWPAAIGPLAAKRFLLTGDPVAADEAHRLGLATEVVDDDADPTALRTTARRWADRLAAGAPLALAGTKAAVNQSIKQALATAFDLSTAYELDTFRSADHAEALAAIRDRRPPRFEGI